MSLVVQKAHEIINTANYRQLAIDATCGNGHDTLFLLENFEEVYAFDIQSLAIKRTKEKTSNYDNLRLIKSDFKKIDSYVKAADAIMFNLGFLPGSNKKIKTSDYDPAEAILKAYDILNSGGVMSIACYTKHEGGSEEFLKIKTVLKKANIDFKLHDGFENDEVLIEVRK